MATTAVAPGTTKVAQVSKSGAGFQIVKAEIPAAGQGQVRSSLVTNEEERLLACARGGDAAAFASLVMPHRDGIFRLAQRILRNREDAEVAVQTAFLDALRHLHSFQGRSRFFFVAYSYCSERSFHEIALGSTENRNVAR